MGKIYQNITSLVGNTPLLELSTIEREENLEARVIVKLEYFNPGGSSVAARSSLAAPSSSPPAATRAWVWQWWLLPRATRPSS